MTTANEQLVLDFIHAAYGQKMDVEAMTAMMAEDFVWQLNVPRSKVVKGRAAARAELIQHSELSTGMIEGSEIQTVVSSGNTVVVERIDVNDVGAKVLRFNVVAIFDVRDGKLTGWREYWDTGHIAQQLGIDAAHMFDALEP
ncbi:nuclear transport factor 2 family protein [Mycobacterium sp. OTB74]|uniref:nuclear transport factor 2 family protein n=1 Tax=Mycobacterium sp. OTB74 TaxID=1853452 RepID=UPI0024751B5E|nr:nuclear transport factor 2 family protein [Mycobacterium sp. OTB74]MDH6243973.1 limonene-1,2-epoxide hydrolase [Mycobacterium sp. OTB74]